jgi:hypothetical protein
MDREEWSVGVMEYWSSGKPRGKTRLTMDSEFLLQGSSTGFCLLSSAFFFPVLQYSNTPLLQSLEVLS